MAFMWTLIPFSIGILGGTAICLPVTRNIAWSFVLYVWAYLCVDSQILLYAHGLEGDRPNWIGKAGSILLAFAVIYLLRISPLDSGMLLPKRDSYYWILIGSTGATVFSVWVNYIYRNHNQIVAQTVLYEAFLPGFAEEIVYRGVAYGLLLKAFQRESTLYRVGATAFVTILTFSLVHAFPFYFGGGPIRWQSFIFALILGAWFTFLRQKTGSILAPAIAHNVANLLGLLASTVH